MKIYPHFSVVGFCNTYVVVPDGGGKAVVIDPGHVDLQLVELITRECTGIEAVLATHAHEAHTAGIGTLRKIWDFPIYAAQPNLLEPFDVRKVRDGQRLVLGRLPVEAILVPGHSMDSMVYVIDKAVFSGDTLEAARIAHTQGYLEQDLLVDMIERRIMSLDEHYLLFPGHGPISRLATERMFNKDLARLRKVSHVRDFWKQEA